MKRLAILKGRIYRYLRRKRAANGKRLLVNEILSIQVLSAGLIGLFAIASLYWGGQWVLKDNYGRWALQWTEELNELGSPLYLNDDTEALMRLESFVERYPEIHRVVYFDKDGGVLFSVDSRDVADAAQDLSEERLDEAVAVIGNDKPYVMEAGILDPRQFDILAPVWVESLPGDGLFAYDPNIAADEAKTELVGFVGIHLDFVLFHHQLLSTIRGAVLILVILLVIFGLFGRYALRNALASISNLREPIRQLAKGDLTVKFQPAEHREISDIVEAL